MAKNKFSADDFGFGGDLDLDFNDFNVTVDQVKDDRSPVSSITAAVGRGVKEAASDPSNYERLIKQTMPKGYGDAINVFNESNKELKGLYNSVADEIRPAMNTARQTTNKFMPKIEKYAPKFLAKQAKKFADGAIDNNSGSKTDYREDGMRRTMEAIFIANQEQQAQASKQEDGRETIRQATEQIRHRDTTTQLDEIRQAVQATAKYNNTINYNVSKQQLELGFRTYWTIADLLKETRANNKVVQGQTKAIVKNTGLPDFVKTTATERFSEITRNRFLDTARDSMFAGTRDYVRRFAGNLKKQTMQKLTPAAQSAEMAMQMAQMGMDMDDGSGPSFMEALISKGTSLGVEAAGDYGAKKLKPIVAKSAAARRVGARLGYESGKIGDTIYDGLNDPTKDWGPFEMIRNMLADASPNRQAESTMETDKFGRLNRPTPFSAQTAKSINEIIPGYLAHIHRELKMMRTGTKVDDLLTYDFTKNQFGSEASTGNAIKSLFSGRNAKATTEGADRILSMVDKGGRLSEAQRDIARKKIMERITKGESLDSTRSTKAFTWGGGDDGSAIADAFQRHLRTDEGKITHNEQSMKRQGKINDEYNRIASGAIDPRAMIQTLINLGQRNQLLRAGVITEGNQVNRETLATLMSGGEVGHSFAQDDTDVALGGMRGASSDRSRVERMPNPASPVAPVTTSGTTDPGDQKARELQEAMRSQQASILDLMRKREERDSIQGTTALDPHGRLDCPCNPEQGTQLTAIGETLLRIEQLITSATGATLDSMWKMYKVQNFGLKLRGGKAPIDDEEDQAPSDEFMGPQKPTDKSFTSLWEHAASSGMDTARKGLAFGRKAIRPAMSTIDKVSQYLNAKKNTLGAMLSAKLGDIYIPGEAKARLTKGGLMAGLYFDKLTGLPIKSLDEINGDIVDQFGNTIVTLEELKTSFVGGRVNKALTDIIGNITTKGTELLGTLRNVIPDQVQRTVEGLRRGVKAVKDKLPAFDVYVDGDFEKPVLYASMMRYDKYFSRKTGKSIKHPRDIDGEIVDADGNIVINEEQIKTGLVDVNGIGIHNVAGRMVGKLATVLKKGAGILATVGGGALGAMAEYFKKFNGLVADLFVPFRDILANSGRTVTALYEIYDLLNDRLPGAKAVRGDKDGDGVRDGSAADIRTKKTAEDEKNKSEKDKDDEKKQNTSSGGLLKSLLKGLTGAGAAGAAADGDGDGGDTNIVGGVDAGGGKDKDGKDTKGKDGKGKPTKAPPKGLGGKAASLGGKALGLGGAALGAVLSPSTLLLSALMGSLKLGGAALGLLGTGAAAAGGAAMAIAPAVGAAIAALFTWPVLVGAAVVGAGYMAYKHSQTTKTTVLSKIRLVQYGIKADNAEEAKRFFKLEQMHEKGTSISSDGEVKFDPKSIEPKEALDLFEITDRRTMNIFNAWYKKRFIVVYKRHIQELWKIKKSATLKDVESVVPSEKKKQYVTDTTTGMASVHNEPSGWNARYPKAETNDSDVQNIVNETSAILSKESDKVTGDKTKAVANMTVASIAKHSAEELAEKAVNREGGYVAKDKNGNELTDITVGDLTAKIKSGAATVSVAVAAPSNLLHVESNRLDALSSIRFKAYGLEAMVYPKVRAIGALELLVEKNLIETKSGVTLTIPTDKVLEIAGIGFGVAATKGEHGRAWISWFNGRFLPVFLTYSSGLRKVTGKSSNQEALRALPIIKQLELARAIIGTTGVSTKGSSNPVWDNPSSPWNDGVPLNDNPDSTASNLETIRLLADKIVLQEATTSATSKDQQRRNADPSKAAMGIYPGGHKKHGNTSNWGQSDKTDSWGKGASATGDMISGAKGSGFQVGSNSNPNYTKTNVGGGTSLTGMGNATTVSEGNGGQYSQMDPGNADGWEALKKTIIQAAGIVGVDAKTLAAMISIESGFRRGIKPIRNGKLMSSAEGLGQFLDGTWNQMMKKYGAKYGIPPGTPKSDARASALMTAAYIKDNLAGVKKKISRQLTATDAYILHFFGPGDGATFLQASANDNASTVVPTPARQHPEYFFDKGRPRTVQEVYQILTKKMSDTGKGFGVKESDFGQSSALATDSKAAEATAAVGSAGTGAAPKDPLALGPVPPSTSGGSPALNASTGAAGAAAATQNSGKLVTDKPPVSSDATASRPKGPDVSEAIGNLQAERSVSFTPTAKAPTSTRPAIETEVRRAKASNDYMSPTSVSTPTDTGTPARGVQTTPRAVIPLRTDQSAEERNAKAQADANKAMPYSKDILDVLNSSNGYHKDTSEILTQIRELLLKRGTTAPSNDNSSRQPATGQKAKPQATEASPVPMTRKW